MIAEALLTVSRSLEYHLATGVLLVPIITVSRRALLAALASSQCRTWAAHPGGGGGKGQGCMGMHTVEQGSSSRGASLRNVSPSQRVIVALCHV